MTDILGISAFYHDSAACLLRDGEIIAAAQEERFNRKKHYSGFPSEAVRYCLREGGIALGDCFRSTGSGSLARAAESSVHRMGYHRTKKGGEGTSEDRGSLSGARRDRRGPHFRHRPGRPHRVRESSRGGSNPESPRTSDWPASNRDLSAGDRRTPG